MRIFFFNIVGSHILCQSILSVMHAGKIHFKSDKNMQIGIEWQAASPVVSMGLTHALFFTVTNI